MKQEEERQQQQQQQNDDDGWKLSIKLLSLTLVGKLQQAVNICVSSHISVLALFCLDSASSHTDWKICLDEILSFSSGICICICICIRIFVFVFVFVFLYLYFFYLYSFF